jgi:hypothetical protein
MRGTILTILALVGGAPGVSLAETLIRYRTEVDDIFGNPTSSVTVGDDFLVKVFVQDVRTPIPNFSGVFGASIDLSFQSNLASYQFLAINNEFSLTQQVTFPTLDLITVSGARDSVLAPGSSEDLFFTLTFHAVTPGLDVFVPSFNGLLGQDSLLYGLDLAVSESQSTFEGATVAIVPEPSTMALMLGAFLAVSTGYGSSGLNHRQRPQSSVEPA